MGKVKQKPVFHTIMSSFIFRSREEHWVKVMKGTQKYQRKLNATGFDTLEVFNKVGKKIVYILDYDSALTYTIDGDGKVELKGKVRSHSPRPF